VKRTKRELSTGVLVEHTRYGLGFIIGPALVATAFVVSFASPFGGRHGAKVVKASTLTLKRRR